MRFPKETPFVLRYQSPPLLGGLGGGAFSLNGNYSSSDNGGLWRIFWRGFCGWQQKLKKNPGAAGVTFLFVCALLCWAVLTVGLEDWLARNKWAANNKRGGKALRCSSALLAVQGAGSHISGRLCDI